MGEAEGPTKWQDRRVERWHDKRMRKEGCNLGNKKHITVRLAEQGKLQAKKGRTIMSHLLFVTWCHHASMMKVTS